MANKNYQIIEHIADIGIRVKASEPKGLFSAAAKAMFSIIAEPLKQKKQEAHKFSVGVKADNYEELLVNWLNELLSLSAVEEKIFTNFKFVVFGDRELEAEATGFDVSGYKINTEIKAATYRNLKVEQVKGSWIAEVIFDV